MMKGHLAVETLKTTGSFPLWNPYIFGGLPYVDAMHGDIFYITALLRMILPVGTVMALVFVLQIIVAGIFTYGFLRTLKISKMVSLLGGIAYMFSGSIVSFVDAGHDGKVIVASFLPAGLFLIQKALTPQTKRRLTYFALLGLVIGLALLSPHLQMTYYMLMMMAFFIIFKFLVLGFGERKWRFASKTLGLAVGSLALGFAISAIQFLPSISYLAFSPRGEGGRGWEWNTSWSLPRLELFDLFNPRFSGLGPQNYWGSNAFKQHTEYFGIIILALVIVGVILAWRRRETRFFAGFSLFGILMALGGNTFFYRLPYTVFPLLSSFRAPAMIFFTVTFSATVLAALGLEAMVKLPVSEVRENRKVRIAVVVFATLGGLSLLFGVWSSLAPQGFGAFITSLGKLKTEGADNSSLQLVEAGIYTLLAAGVIRLWSLSAKRSQDLKGPRPILVAVLWNIANGKGKKNRGWLWGCLLVALFLTVIFLGYTRTPVNPTKAYANIPNAARGFWLGFVFLMGGFATIMLWRRTLKFSWGWGFLLTVLVFTDLWLVDRHFVNVVRDRYGKPISADQLYAPDEVVTFLKKDPGIYRVFPLQFRGQDLYRRDSYLMLHGVQSLGGYHGNQLGRYQEFIGSPGTIMFRDARNLRYPAFLTALDVRYLIGVRLPSREDFERLSPQDQQTLYAVYAELAPWLDTTQSSFRPVFAGQRYVLYRNTAPHSRAWLCTAVEVITQDEAILERMKRTDFDPRRTVILEEQPEGWQPSGDTLAAGTVEVTRYEPNVIELSADVRRPAVLVLSENWYPWYRAWVDGVERKVYRADYTLRAVPLEPGSHQVVFRFRSPYVTVGMWITFIALGLIGLVIASSLISNRKKRKES